MCVVVGCSDQHCLSTTMAAVGLTCGFVATPYKHQDITQDSFRTHTLACNQGVALRLVCVSTL